MDKPAFKAYPQRMIARAISLLAILAVTIMTAVSSGHAAQMQNAVSPDHSRQMDSSAGEVVLQKLGCENMLSRDHDDAERCEQVCAGLTALLIPTGGEAGNIPGSSITALPSKSIHISRAPKLETHPPKLGLL